MLHCVACYIVYRVTAYCVVVLYCVIVLYCVVVLHHLQLISDSVFSSLVPLLVERMRCGTDTGDWRHTYSVRQTHTQLDRQTRTQLDRQTHTQLDRQTHTQLDRNKSDHSKTEGQLKQ